MTTSTRIAESIRKVNSIYNGLKLSVVASQYSVGSESKARTSLQVKEIQKELYVALDELYALWQEEYDEQNRVDKGAKAEDEPGP